MLVPQRKLDRDGCWGGVVPNQNEETRPASLVEASTTRAGWEQGAAPCKTQNTVSSAPQLTIVHTGQDPSKILFKRYVVKTFSGHLVSPASPLCDHSHEL